MHLTGGDYGWRVWQDKTTEALMPILNEGKSQEWKRPGCIRDRAMVEMILTELMWKFLSVKGNGFRKTMPVGGIPL